MASADVVYILTGKLFPHGPRCVAARAGARVLSLCMVDEGVALRALDLDYMELSRVTRTLAEGLAEADEVFITTSSGTELRLKVRGQPAMAIDGLAREPGRISALPAGVAAVLPTPETAQGRVVLDGSLASLGLLSEPIVLAVERGRVVEVQGGAEAAELRRAFGKDANAICIAEFGIGTNPKAIYTGNLVEDERVRGSAHIGFGGNTHLGGTIESNFHRDGTLRAPTIYLDGELIVKDGKLVP
jgi:leucyl aminopeptidase (aminopeptidase T)